MALHLRHLQAGLALLVLVSLAATVAAEEIETVTDGVVNDIVDGAEAQAPPEVQQAVDEAKKGLDTSFQGGSGDGAGNVPSNPIGREQGIDAFPEAVTNIIAENWEISLGIAVLSIAVTVAGFRLASRYIDPTVALQSPERSMLYGFVKGNPGVHLKQLSTEFKMKTSTVLWHVRKLESADLIRSKKANGYRVFYPVSGGMEASKVSEAVTALSNVNARSVFAFLAENPEAALRDLSDRLNINGGTIRWHLKKLRSAGLLEEVGAVVRVTDLGVKAWNQIQGNPAMQIPVTPLVGEQEPVAQVETVTVRME